MTLNVGVTDDEFGRYCRRTVAIADRLGKSLSFERVMDVLQLVHDNKFEEAIKAAENVAIDDSVSKLLKSITTIEVASIASFIANKKFREGKTTDGVKIAWLGSNVKENFLGKTEADVARAILRIQKLKENSLDTPILTELGDTAETALAQLWELLKKQGSGKKGKLLVDGWANIAYIRDKNNVLWAVHAFWNSDHVGWVVEASSVGNPIRWSTDVQFVSR